MITFAQHKKRGNILQSKNQSHKTLNPLFSLASVCAVALCLSACLNETGTNETTQNNTTSVISALTTTCTPQSLAITLATASSQQAAAYAAKFAVDGISTTRWSSDKAAVQTLTLDLGKVSSFNSLNINWQTAYSKAFTIDVSADGITNWTTIATSSATKSGLQNVIAIASSRYVRIRSTMATTWGNVSIIDVQVLSTASCEVNLLTRGWNKPDAGNTSWSLDSTVLNAINFNGGFFCPPNGSTIFTQSVTSPGAVNKLHLSLEIANFSGNTSTGCNSFSTGNTTFEISLGGIIAASYTPNAPYFSAPFPGCVAGNGILDVDFTVPFTAGQSKDLIVNMRATSFAAGSTGCGGYAETFNIKNAKLIKVQ